MPKPVSASWTNAQWMCIYQRDTNRARACGMVEIDFNHWHCPLCYGRRVNLCDLGAHLGSVKHIRNSEYRIPFPTLSSSNSPGQESMHVKSEEILRYTPTGYRNVVHPPSPLIIYRKQMLLCPSATSTTSLLEPYLLRVYLHQLRGMHLPGRIRQWHR